MRVVLDTNVLVRAAGRGAGPAAELLKLIAGSGSHTLILSPFLLQELERVLAYDRVRAITRLSADEASEYVSHLRSGAWSEFVQPGPAPRVVTADRDDDPVVHTAIVGKADILCTLNRDFYDPPVVAYCNARGVLILNDVDLLNYLCEPGTSQS